MSEWKELATKASELTHSPIESFEGKSTEELREIIAGFYWDPEIHLPRIQPMLGYDATMEFSENEGEFWEKFSSKEWVAEPKFDDVRILLFFWKGRVRLQSRGRHKHTQLFHEVTENFPQFQKFYKPEFEGMVIDGGLIAGVDPGKSRNLWANNDLLLMCSIVSSSPERSAEIQKEKGEPRYVMWDIIKTPDDPEFFNKPLFERRKVLEKVFKQLSSSEDGKKVFIIPSQWQDFKQKYESVTKRGGEGLMLKKIDAPYQFRRSKDWLKLKRYEDIVGVVHSKCRDGNNAWQGLVGSINVADPKTGKVIGAVGTMTLEMRKKISTPDGDLNPEFIGKRLVMRIYRKHAETENPRHARLLYWLDSDMEEKVKEEISNE